MIDNSPEFRIKKAIGTTVMLLLVTFAALPTLWALLLAFRAPDAVFEPIWESPLKLTFDNFFNITRSDFPKALMNSFITAGLSTVFAMLVGVPAGFALAKSRVSGKFIASWILLLLRMAPPVGFVIPLFLLYVNAGLIDTYAGLVFAYMTLTLPLVTWSMWNSFSQVPDELIEAAIMDDASLTKAFLLIALPAARPGAVAAAILAFLVAWNDFFYSLIITRSDTTTAPVAVMNFISFDSVDWASIAVASIALTLPILPLMAIANRYIVQSLSGAVKG
ncbi:MAG: carbohydrate ABC transporter permease [Marinovum algicola]|jgi:multiple sugar transport system permease protein|uniref:Multiple sugar transport system permease protein n=1 Tax=Marinovum algicola TaxID=42444 RepID=A0A975WB98_9RHOB|nr:MULTISPECIES: carbohydrate ABC transporter permease [Marinovum]MDD9744033.1 carbohydrate ABC transporter permease [Marinovum sp. PR37]SEJ72244.1 multiple sugar transport system permease protein [Marinovum algicola]SLN57594.1 Trehalose transport system permease protein SugB [Marinovum algicola]